MGCGAQSQTRLGAVVLSVVGGLVSLPSSAPAADPPAMRDFIGLNVHSYAMTPHVGLYAPVASQVRDYHNLTWDLQATSADARFPKGAPGTESWLDWNHEYGTWAAAGMRTNMDILFETFAQNNWSNRAADSYKYGKSVAQYFGPSGAGNGLITSVELGNEPGSYSDTNYVTVVRNMAQGIRDYAPTLPIVSCNVTVGPSGQYSKNVNLFRTNNMLPLVDVLATHTYPMLQGWPTWERSYPEDPRLTYLSDVQNLIDWRDTYAPGKEVWVTEFGYDATTKPNEPDGTFKDIKFVTDKQQAQYLTRSYLMFASMGVDRAYAYYFNDDDEPTLHASSGLTRNWQPKPSYHAIRHLQETLGDYRFTSVVSEDPDSLFVHLYTHESDPSDMIYAIWSPTGSDREALYTLSDLPGEVLSAELMPLAAGTAPLVPYQLLSPDEIRLTVGESPIYLHMVAVPEPTSLALSLTATTLLLRRRRPQIPS